MIAILKLVLSAGFIAGLVRLILTSLGIGIITYVGFDHLMSWVVSTVQGKFTSGMGSDLAGILGLSGIDYSINMILSGVSIRIMVMQLKRFGIL